MNRPEITLFMLMSVDGKISTGDSDDLDFDRDLPKIVGVKEGLHQYYDLEQQTDLHSLNTGRVMEKIGMNDKRDEPDPLPVSFVLIDNKPHLATTGITYLSKKFKNLIIVTSLRDHPAASLNLKNVFILNKSSDDSFAKVFKELKNNFAVDALTVQSGGTLNAELLHEGLIDHLSIVVAPLLVGGATTSTLIDGEANHSLEDLKRCAALKLISVTPLNSSYLHLKYDVVK